MEINLATDELVEIQFLNDISVDVAGRDWHCLSGILDLTNDQLVRLFIPSNYAEDFIYHLHQFLKKDALQSMRCLAKVETSLFPWVDERIVYFASPDRQRYLSPDECIAKWRANEKISFEGIPLLVGHSAKGQINGYEITATICNPGGSFVPDWDSSGVSEEDRKTLGETWQFGSVELTAKYNLINLYVPDDPNSPLGTTSIIPLLPNNLQAIEAQINALIPSVLKLAMLIRWRMMEQLKQPTHLPLE